MIDLIAAFITGLTAGGLSCLAVQGGFLASSLAGQIENDLASKPRTGRRGKSRDLPQKQSGLGIPIAAFLAAKLAVYTVLGFLLGAAGQVFQLSPYTRAFLQIAVGIFMLGTALRMLNVHPIFRYFAFEPPAFLRRKLRRQAAAGKDGSTLAGPVIMGLLTVLIPCGVTQAMMAAALAAGSPWSGAALMFAFTLGTSPVFFAATYFAFSLGKRLEKNFTRVTAAVILVLALVTINTGLVLSGSPLAFSRLTAGLFPGSTAEAAVPNATPSPLYSSVGPSAPLPDVEGSESGSVVTVNVLNYGYTPDVVHAKAGEPLTVRFVTDNTRSCSRALVIPKLGVQKLLEATGQFLVSIPAQEQGAVIPYSCSMGMYGGMIVFDL